MTQQLDPAFEDLLHLLRKEHGFDFTGYKRASVRRRVQRRMEQVSIHGFEPYAAYLKTHPHEFTDLFNTILINVTSFFRDREAWDYLAAEVLPAIVEAKPPLSNIRVWCAGCASGQEAYSIAILLAEQLGPEQFLARVKIYGTDVDDDALAHARDSFTSKEVGGLDPALLQKYFRRKGSGYAFRADLRRVLIFGRHDLVHDAPISKLDLVICRNTLMYFDATAQKRVLERLHYALNSDGVLFLGKAEMLMSHPDLFRAVSLKNRVFRRVDGVAENGNVLAELRRAGDNLRPMARRARIRDLALESSPVAQLTVDSAGNLVLVNEEARTMFSITQDDLGKPLRDLQVSYRPVELRSRIDEATEQRKQVDVSGVEWHTLAGEVHLLDVRVYPLVDPDGSVQGCNVSFSDVTRYLELQHDLERSRLDLETAYEELQSANEELQTTNEELQSTVEELETTNEELQSSNEELETMNEELESTNNELQTINNELQVSTGDFDTFREVSQSVFTDRGLAVIALDPEFRVRTWNSVAEELWGMKATETVGEPFFGMDFGLPVNTLVEPVRDCLNKGAGFHGREVTGVNRRGRPIQFRVTGVPFGADDRPSGVALLVEKEGAAD